MRYAVAIPARNAARTLGAVLDGVDRLVWRPSSVLVVDDCSSDATARTALERGARVVAHATPRGLAGARNTALAHITEPVVLWLDADFVPDPGVPEVLWAALQDEGVAGAGGRAREQGDSRADLWRRVHAPQDHGRRPRSSVWMIMGLCSMHRVDVLRGVGGFDERFRTCGEDVEMSLRLRRCGYRLAYCPEASGDHLRGDDEASLVPRMVEYVRMTSAALALHGFRPRRRFVPILLKQAIVHPLGDLLRGRWSLIPLDWVIWHQRWKAVCEGNFALPPPPLE